MWLKINKNEKLKKWNKIYEKPKKWLKVKFEDFVDGKILHEVGWNERKK